MRDFLLFVSGNPLIANSEGKRKVKKEKKKKGEERKVKPKTALAALAGKGICCSHRLSIKS